MSPTLIVLASILAVFALVLIPLMMVKSDAQTTEEQLSDPGNQRVQKLRRKKKKR